MVERIGSLARAGAPLLIVGMTGMDKETSGPRTKAIRCNGVAESIARLWACFWSSSRRARLPCGGSTIKSCWRSKAGPRNLAHVLAEHLDRTFGPIESALNQLAVYSDRIGGPQAPRDAWGPVMAATLSGLSGIGSLNVIDADGILKRRPIRPSGASRREGYIGDEGRSSAGLIVAPAVPVPLSRGDHPGRSRIA
jgi:hypothetical protein